MKPSALLIIIVLLAGAGAAAYALPRDIVAELGTEEYRAPERKKLIQKPKEKTSAVVAFTGDVMLGRYVETLSTLHGAQYPFERVGSLLVAPDLAVINLEGPILQNHVKTPSQGFSFSFASTTAILLAEQGIDVANIANNHTADKGSNGYADTTRYLTSAGVEYVGHPNIYTDEYVLRKKINGQDIIFIAFNYTNPNFSTAKAIAFVASTTEQAADQEFVVAMIHGGVEYEMTSSKSQKAFYRGLVDAGADLIIGHHPHVVQEIELYKEKPIFYSLGNFIFDQYFSKDVQEGLVVNLELSNNRASYELVPVSILRSQPQAMEGDEKEKFLESLSKRSPSVATDILRGTVDVSR